MPTIRTCIVCGKQYTLPKYYKFARKTCSEQCRYQLVSNQFTNRVTRKCLQCGKEFSTTPSYKQTLCSPVCKLIYMSGLFRGKGNPNWKETKTLRPSNKKSIRSHIHARDKVCRDCGSTKTLQVHHIDSDPQNNLESNLVLLCKMCHALRHKNMGEENVVGLVLVNRTYRRTPNRMCVVCGKDFAPRHSDDKCCSSHCAHVQSGLSRRKPT